VNVQFAGVPVGQAVLATRAANDIITRTENNLAMACTSRSAPTPHAEDRPACDGRGQADDTPAFSRCQARPATSCT
jgi:hypothetical protein